MSYKTYDCQRTQEGGGERDPGHACPRIAFLKSEQDFNFRPRTLQSRHFFMIFWQNLKEFFPQIIYVFFYVFKRITLRKMLSSYCLTAQKTFTCRRTGKKSKLTTYSIGMLGPLYFFSLGLRVLLIQKAVNYFLHFGSRHIYTVSCKAAYIQMKTRAGGHC